MSSDLEQQHLSSFTRSAPTDGQVDVIYTVNGGPELCRKLHRSPVLLLGYESRRTRPSNGEPVAFVDWPFNREFEPSFEEHLQTVKEEQPRLAVAPDIEADQDLEDVLELADQLDPHVTEEVIVVPKTVDPGDVDDKFRVGVPLATGWGSNDETNHPTAYQRASSLHFLGGTPSMQAKAVKEWGLVPDSVDGASVGKAAGFGDVWHQLESPQYASIADDVMKIYDSAEVRSRVGRERMPYIDRTIQALHNVCYMYADLFDYTLPEDVPRWPGDYKVYSGTAARFAGRGAPPCQHPDCIEPTHPIHDHITCVSHEPV